MRSGGLDYILKIWDFPDEQKAQFYRESINLSKVTPLMLFLFDPDGKNFLCCTTNN
jgi:hypothetical protein